MENKEYRKLMDDYHAIVCDKECEMIRKYKNLGGLHKFVSQRWKQALYSNNRGGGYILNHEVEPIKVWLYESYKMPDEIPFGRTHKLVIEFANGDFAYIFFGSYQVMLEHVKRWRNLKGLPLIEYRSEKVISAHREESTI